MRNRGTLALVLLAAGAATGCVTADISGCQLEILGTEPAALGQPGPYPRLVGPALREARAGELVNSFAESADCSTVYLGTELSIYARPIRCAP